MSDDRRLILGVTGTRHGTTDAQHRALAGLIKRLNPTEFHHGDCKGVDDEAARLACQLSEACRVVARPGPDGEWRAHNKYTSEVLPEKTHFARNRDIVDCCDALIVCPRETERQERGGTWYTYDYARKAGRKVYLIFPDGTVREESPSVLRA